MVQEVKVRGNELILRFPDASAAKVFVELIQKLGIKVGEKVEHRVRIDNDLVKWMYSISEDDDGETPRQYINYIRRFEGLTLDQAVGRAGNSWE
ncbi:MAG: hypothetical protein J7J11_03525, partial [Desulfurococcales archaeon]|nr:hypothetical protein [Desulfurococcales archaeon]